MIGTEMLRGLGIEVTNRRIVEVQKNRIAKHYNEVTGIDQTWCLL